MAISNHPTTTPRRKNVILAVALQCLPLVGAVGLIAAAFADQGILLTPSTLLAFARSQGSAVPWTALLLGAPLLFWGLGYRYVGLRRRFLVTALLGPGVTAGLYLFSFYSLSGVFETHPEIMRVDFAAANRAALRAGSMIAGIVLLCAVDAERLASRHNAEVERAGGV